MERELQYPEFLTPQAQKKEKFDKKIEKLKIYRKTFGLLALGVGIGLAAPKVNATIKEAVRISIENDNKNFHDEATRNAEHVLATTGMTTEEIMGRGKNPYYDDKIQEKLEEEKQKELERLKTEEEIEDDKFFGMYAEDHKDDMTVYPEDIAGRTR